MVTGEVMQMNLSAKRWALCLLVVALGYVPCAVAVGFFIPGVGARGMARGGAFQVLADDLTALAPTCGLSRIKGTRFMYNHNLWAPSTFTRTPSVMANDFSDDL